MVKKIIHPCRQIKSRAELALLAHAKNTTLEVHRAAARILYEGITTTEVQSFLDKAHLASGMDGPSTFKIVLFWRSHRLPARGGLTRKILREGRHGADRYRRHHARLPFPISPAAMCSVNQTPANGKSGNWNRQHKPPLLRPHRLARPAQRRTMPPALLSRRPVMAQVIKHPVFHIVPGTALGWMCTSTLT